MAAPERPPVNLRGAEVFVTIGDQVFGPVTVITHIRGDRWMVEGRALPKRFEQWRGCRRAIVPRDQMDIYQYAEEVR